MSETQDLIALYGAIDLQLQHHPELIADIAPLLPGYLEPGTLGWYEAFRSWTLDQAPDTNFPDLETAIANMSNAETVKPRSAARRLLAVAALTRAFPGPTGPTDVTLAPVLDFAGTLGPGQTLDLLGLASGPEFHSIDLWANLLTLGSNAGFVSESLLAQTSAPPTCTHSVVQTPLGGALVPAAQLETSFWTSAVDFTCASRFLDPLQWPHCSDFWCDVTKVGTATNATKAINPVYREEVSLDCTHRATTWGVSAYLECRHAKTASSDRLIFDLAPSWTSPGDEVMVDEGWLSVRKENSGIRVETVKRIKFRHLFSPTFLATAMCVAGYGDLAGDLMFNCAINCKPTSSKKGKKS